MLKTQNDSKRQDSHSTLYRGEPPEVSINKKKILEFAQRFNIDICFRENLEIGNKNITIKWSSGITDFYEILIKPELINDCDEIKLDSRLVHTKHKAPTL